MTADIRPGRPEDREPILDLLESAFGFRELFARYMDEVPDYAPDDFVLAWDDGHPVSCVQMFGMQVRLAGRAVRLGGIGSVATHPDARGRGLASQLMRTAASRMRERGAPLALLFTGRHTFYAPLGWHVIPRRAHTLRLPWRRRAAPDGVRLRAFTHEDLPAVRTLYDAYNADLSCTTLRDARYWQGNLRYAGAPDEAFVVAEDEDGGLLAYARSVTLYGLPGAMEYARVPGAAHALAAAIESHMSARAAYALPGRFDTDLLEALAERGVKLEPLEDPSPMWKVLDADTLRSLAGVHRDVDDADLLARLVGGERAIFWASDRF